MQSRPGVLCLMGGMLTESFAEVDSSVDRQQHVECLKRTKRGRVHHMAGLLCPLQTKIYKNMIGCRDPKGSSLCVLGGGEGGMLLA